jgi:NADPH2:quinone reductase
MYSSPLPITLGREASGTIEAVGDDVDSVQVGDRVAYAMVPGAYAEYAAVPASQLVKVPSGS